MGFDHPKLESPKRTAINAENITMILIGIISLRKLSDQNGNFFAKRDVLCNPTACWENTIWVQNITLRYMDQYE